MTAAGEAYVTLVKAFYGPFQICSVLEILYLHLDWRVLAYLMYTGLDDLEKAIFYFILYLAVQARCSRTSLIFLTISRFVKFFLSFASIVTVILDKSIVKIVYSGKISINNIFQVQTIIIKLLKNIVSNLSFFSPI